MKADIMTKALALGNFKRKKRKSEIRIIIISVRC